MLASTLSVGCFENCRWSRAVIYGTLLPGIETIVSCCYFLSNLSLSSPSRYLYHRTNCACKVHNCSDFIISRWDLFEIVDSKFTSLLRYQSSLQIIVTRDRYWYLIPASRVLYRYCRSSRYYKTVIKLACEARCWRAFIFSILILLLSSQFRRSQSV